MPEFIPQHDNVPGLGDRRMKLDREAFIRGYLGAAEWTLDTDSPPEEGGIDRDNICGWSADSIRSVKTDCTDFMSDNRKKLEKYMQLSGRDESSAGMDFWLSRNGHGAGFFDRGNDPVFNELQDAARQWGSRDAYLNNDGELEFQ